MAKITTLKPNIPTLDTRRGSSVAVERIRGGRLAKIRERIALRDECTCQICGRVTTHGEVDHIVPLYVGGQETDENRQWLCAALPGEKPQCHEKKSEEEEKGRGK
jgi:5-methylcytosine-specific restriction endonuclease McrA